MRSRYRGVIVVASSLALLLSAAGARGSAQAPAQSLRKTPQDMMTVPDGSHQALLMAYRDNVATFARAIQRQATLAKAVDLGLARPAIAEMRRSFAQIQLHHQALATMDDQSKQRRETRLAALNEHLTALEAELNGATPDPKKVAAQATEILHQCAGVPLPAEAKPLSMKGIE